MASFPVASFDRTNSDQLVCSNPSIYSPGVPFYVSCFVKLDSFAANLSIVGSTTWVVSTIPNQIGFVVSNTVPTLIGVVPVSVQAGLWYFVEAWNDGATLHLCVTRCDRFDLANESTIAFVGTMATSAGPFVLGRIQKGSIHSLAVMNAIPTLDQRNELYNLGTAMPFDLISDLTKSKLVAFWELDEATGNRVDKVASIPLVPSGSISQGTRSINSVVNEASTSAVDEAVYRWYKSRRLDQVFSIIVDDGGNKDDAVVDRQNFPFVTYETMSVGSPSQSSSGDYIDQVIKFVIRNPTKEEMQPLVNELVRCFSNSQFATNDGGRVLIGRLQGPPTYARETRDVWMATIQFTLKHYAPVDRRHAFGG